MASPTAVWWRRPTTTRSAFFDASTSEEAGDPSAESMVTVASGARVDA
jgi:hypothetical protein